MSDTCESCAHWRPLDFEHIRYTSDDDPVRTGSWGQCSMIRQSADSSSSDEGEESRSQRAFTSDASGYSSWFTTRSDFGCVEHARLSSETTT